MRIILICKDMGGFIGKVADYLRDEGHAVLFLDTAKSAPALGWLSGKLRSALRARLGPWLEARKIARFGHADTLLVVNPGQSPGSTIEAAMRVARTHKASLYDSLARSPVRQPPLSRYHQVYSFDHTDIASHRLIAHYNFMYGAPQPAAANTTPRYKAFVVMSGVDRLPVMEKIAQQLENAGYPTYNFRIQTRHGAAPGSKIVHTRERISLEEVRENILEAQILVDLIRPRQSGLSFRFFEAMQYGRKVITNNKAVLGYDFYHPQNILVIEDENPQIPTAFLTSAYVWPAAQILHKYSLAGWCDVVFAERN
jgi:hypothetical protein